MQATVEITETKMLIVSLDTKLMAQWFAELDDEKQADFFIEVSRIAKDWKKYQGQQWYLVGAHLRNCECSAFEAREMINELHSGLINV